MNTGQEIELKRDVDAIVIPAGNVMPLKAGNKVRVTQALGGTFTIQTSVGVLARIAGHDADALGLEVPKQADAEPSTKASKSISDLVWDELRTCYDPEIAVNIVELGLIYNCDIKELPEGGYDVQVKMTLTAQGCGMGPSIAMDARGKIQRIPGVKNAQVDVVWNPPWNPSMMSDQAKQRLGLM